MTTHGLISMALFLVALVALAVPLGGYMARVYEGEATFAEKVLGPLERAFYRLAAVRPDQDMTWQQYAWATLLFNLVGVLALYTLQRLQGLLPLNPLRLGAVSPEVSFNTAVSFVSNTNWQAYAGESTMSQLTQMPVDGRRPARKILPPVNLPGTQPSREFRHCRH